MNKPTAGLSYIPFHLPVIGEEEIAEVVATLRSGWLTTGPRTARFEQDFCDYLGSSHALACNSATAGLHLALAACDIGPGDEVITTPLTFCATASVIMHVRATPVLADIGPDGNIDPRSIEQRITPRTRAIMPVHLAGKPCDMDAIWALAKAHNLRVIEDAAHATETLYRGHHLGSAEGSQSDAVAFSFYATKNITTGEGGMVVTNQPELDQKMRSLCLHGINRDAWNRYKENGKWFYQVMYEGFKYNMSDIMAAIGIHQLRKIEDFASRRRELVALYKQELADVEQLELPGDCSDGRHAWHLFMLRLKLDQLSINRAEFMEGLSQRSVGASVHFIPIPMHPYFEPWADLPANQVPHALELYSRIVSLPLYPGLTNEQVKEVCDRVKQVIAASTVRKFAAAASGSEG